MTNEPPPPRYLTMQAFIELKDAWAQDPRAREWADKGSHQYDLPLDMQNIIVTNDGKAPPPAAELVEIRAGEWVDGQ